MKDRVVEFPHGYRDAITGQHLNLEPEPGKVIEEGTPICRGTLLSGQTEKMLGLEDATPDMALQQITALLLSGLLTQNEEREIEAGTFKNTGSGWNTYQFKKPFSTIPTVFLQIQKGSREAYISQITPEKFIYSVYPSTDGKELLGYLAVGGAEQW